MSEIKTALRALLVWLCALTPSAAAPGTTAELVHVFATCAGRFSALEEQQRLFDGAASERTAQTLSDFEGMLDALLPAAQDHNINGRDVLNWRVDAKMAHAVLLQTAKFGQKPLHKQSARQNANQHIATCQSLLLGM